MPFMEGSEQPEEDFTASSVELEAPGLNYKNGSLDFETKVCHLLCCWFAASYSGLFNPCRSALRADVLLQLCNLLGSLLDIWKVPMSSHMSASAPYSCHSRCYLTQHTLVFTQRLPSIDGKS
jgi:hypothetical protein